MAVRPIILAVTTMSLLAGCTSTGPAPNPVPVPAPPSGQGDPFGYNKPVLSMLRDGTSFQGVSLQGQGTQQLSGRVALTGPSPSGNAIVSVGGTNYAIPVQQHYAPNSYNQAEITAWLNEQNNLGILAQEYSYVGYMAQQGVSSNASIHGGWNTPVANLPEQRTQYSGLYGINNGPTGAFDAEADFDNGLFGISLFEGFNQPTVVGGGTGTISGNTFASSLSMTHPVNPSNNIAGNIQGGFYGPAGEEIAGVISGYTEGSGAPVTGIVAGAER